MRELRFPPKSCTKLALICRLDGPLTQLRQAGRNPRSGQVQQRHEPSYRLNIGGQQASALRLLGIGAPRLDLKAFVELRGGVGLRRINAPLGQRQPNDE